MNVIFFGSSKYSVIVEKALFEKFGLSLVVTIPDKPVGRKQILTPSPVKKFAESVIASAASKKLVPLRERNDEAISSQTRLPRSLSVARNDIPIITTDKLDKNIIDQIAKYNPDFLVVADYGLILPNELLDFPKYAPLNVHHSLLPKYRGPSPAPSAILNGDKVSGVTVIKMSEKMDAGDILSQEEYTLRPEETTDSLLTKLNELGVELVLGVIENFDKIKQIPQNEQKVTYTKKITKEDGFFDIDNPPSPQTLDRMIRAYSPWPGTWTKLKMESGELKIIKLLPEQMIQVEGGKPMDIKDFINGYPEAKEKIEKLF